MPCGDHEEPSQPRAQGPCGVHVGRRVGDAQPRHTTCDANASMRPRKENGSSAMAVKDVSVVLAHGAWADGSSWARVIAALGAGGMRVSAAPLPLTSLADD